MENKKPLLSIRELKQWFPVRGKRGLFVKANDGVSLDIYEGETLGIVGESGCGKSTLGRVLLQLYKQTDGETIYYGKPIDDVAPLYVLDIYKNLERKSAKTKLELKKLEALEAEYAEMEAKLGDADEEAKKPLYAKLNEKNELTKKAMSEYQAIVRLVGGFYVAKDFNEASLALVEYFKVVLARRRTLEKLKKVQLERTEAEFAGNQAKAASLQKTCDDLENNVLQGFDAQRKARQEAIDVIRAKYADDEEFQKYEEMRDDGIDLARLKYDEMRLLREELQLIFQDPYSSLNPRLTVGQILAEGPMTHSYFKHNGERMQEYSMELMEKCGLAPYMIHRYPHQFSGGQRQRIGIARALSVQPKFVVCDEAVSALDVSIQSQIINLLQDLKEKENLTYMFISHDLSVVKYISDRIAVMYLGNIVELCTSEEMFKNPLHPYTEALLSAIPTTDLDNKTEMIILEGDIPSPVNPPKGCKFNTRCRDCMEICLQVQPEWKEQVPGHFVACHKYND